jgi:hypothetical protein
VIQLLRPERLGRSLPQQKEGEMNQVEKAARFAELHVKGTPLLLYNAWDAGTAKSILDAGAKAIATSSWAVAEAQGYRDGEAIPITLVEQIIARIVSTIDAPVSVDFEGGYSDDNGALFRGGAGGGSRGCQSRAWLRQPAGNRRHAAGRDRCLIRGRSA